MGCLEGVEMIDRILSALSYTALFIGAPMLILSLEKNDPSPLLYCEVTVAQYGPGERWAPNPKQPTCAKFSQGGKWHVSKSDLKEKK